jgi:hypothetical protein
LAQGRQEKGKRRLWGLWEGIKKKIIKAKAASVRAEGRSKIIKHDALRQFRENQGKISKGCKKEDLAQIY